MFTQKTRNVHWKWSFFFIIIASKSDYCIVWPNSPIHYIIIGGSKPNTREAKKKERMFIALGIIPTFAFYIFFCIFLDGGCTLHITHRWHFDRRFSRFVVVKSTRNVRILKQVFSSVSRMSNIIMYMFNVCSAFEDMLSVRIFNDCSMNIKHWTRETRLPAKRCSFINHQSARLVFLLFSFCVSIAIFLLLQYGNWWLLKMHLCQVDLVR